MPLTNNLSGGHANQQDRPAHVRDVWRTQHLHTTQKVLAGMQGEFPLKILPAKPP